MWIDFEGIDGSGKTAVSTRVAQELRRRGRTVVHAREGGRFASPIAGRVRDFVRSAECLALAPEAELLLNLAREAQLAAEVVRPALARGAWVITDRSTWSHVGLAQHVRGLCGSEAQAAARVALGGLSPDRVFLIDVDPDVARWRRRIRKIRDRQLSDGGRKGLLGERLAWRSREAFHAFARDQNWTVVENTWRPFEETVADVLAALEGRPRPPAPGPRLEAGVEGYFAFAGALGDRSLGAMLAAGLDDPRADGIRRAAPADAAAYAVTGMATSEAWALRDALKAESPYYVARSLSGLGADPRAWALRRELEPAAPDQVLHSLKGVPGEEAEGLRRRHWEAHRAEALRSLGGLDGPAAWELRARARREGPDPALAESLAGLDGPAAWELRAELREAHPLAVLRSAAGLGRPEAWALRRELARSAPKAVLASISGMDVREADALREELWETAPEETAASLWRIDTPAAWRRRAELAPAAPVGTIKSLVGLDRARGEALVGGIRAAHPGRLRVAREAAQFSLEAPCRPSST